MGLVKGSGVLGKRIEPHMGCKGAPMFSKSKGKTAMISPPMRPHTFGEFTAVAVPRLLEDVSAPDGLELRAPSACQARPTPMARMWCD